MNTNAETKHTPGEWRRNGSEIVSGSYPELPYKVIGAIYHDASTNSGKMSYEEAEANAEIICKAVNEYPTLIEENKALKESISELVEALQDIQNTIKKWPVCQKDYELVIIRKTVTAINNATKNHSHENN